VLTASRRSVVRAFLPRKTFKLWEKIKAERCIADAGIDGLESCPFCSYACVMDARPDEKLFTCQNKACLRVS